MVGGIGQAAVTDGTGCLFHQVDDVLGTVHVQRTAAILALLAQHRFLEIGVGPGVVLAAHDDNLVAAAARDADAEIGPRLCLALAAVNVRKLRNRQLFQRIVRVK